MICCDNCRKCYQEANQSRRNGWRNLVSHMKDIDEVKDTQPLWFNHVRYRGVAGSMQSWAGRTHPQQHHSIPQGVQEIFTDHRKPTESPQTKLWSTPKGTPTTHLLWVEQIHLHTINNLSHTSAYVREGAPHATSTGQLTGIKAMHTDD